MSTDRIASRTIGTSSSPPSASTTSSASQDGSGSIRRTSPTRRSPSTTAQPASSCAQNSPSSSAGARSAGTESCAPRSPSAASRPAKPSSRKIGRSGVPARRSIRRGTPSTRISLKPASSRRIGPRHVERAIEPVRAPDPPGLQWGVGHSTMSTRTRRLSFTAAALTTVRSAWAVRPPRPITCP